MNLSLSHDTGRELSQSYDPSRGFNRLTLLDLDIFF